MKHLSIDDVETVPFSIHQDAVGYMKFLDLKLKGLADQEYKDFIEALYQDLKLGPAQKDKLLLARAGSIMDIREMSVEWMDSFGFIGRDYGISTLDRLIDAKNADVIVFGSDEIYKDVDTFSTYMEATNKALENSKYLPNQYYSETSRGQRSLNYDRSLVVTIPPCPITFNLMLTVYAQDNPCKPPNIFQGIWGSVTNWFGDLLSINIELRLA